MLCLHVKDSSAKDQFLDCVFRTLLLQITKIQSIKHLLQDHQHHKYSIPEPDSDTIINIYNSSDLQSCPQGVYVLRMFEPPRYDTLWAHPPLTPFH